MIPEPFSSGNHQKNKDHKVPDRLIEEGYFDYIITYYDDYEWDNYELLEVSDNEYSDYTKDMYIIRYCIYQRTGA